MIASYSFNGNAKDDLGPHDGVVSGGILTEARFGNSSSAYYFGGTNFIMIDISASPDLKPSMISFVLCVLCLFHFFFFSVNLRKFLKEQQKKILEQRHEILGAEDNDENEALITSIKSFILVIAISTENFMSL